MIGRTWDQMQPHFTSVSAPYHNLLEGVGGGGADTTDLHQLEAEKMLCNGDENFVLNDAPQKAMLCRMVDFGEPGHYNFSLNVLHTSLNDVDKCSDLQCT